jgi:hypothetical protein
MRDTQFVASCYVVAFIAVLVFFGTWFYNIIEADTKEEMFAKNGYEQVIVEKIVTEVVWKKVGGDDESNR